MNDLPNKDYPTVLKGAMLEECDLPRLRTISRDVWDIMSDGMFHELNDIAARLGKPHSTITACVRSFRYPENGGHTVTRVRQKEGKGTHLYRLEIASQEVVRANKARAEAERGKGKNAFQKGVVYALVELRKRLPECNTVNMGEGPFYFNGDIQQIINDIMPGEEHD